MDRTAGGRAGEPIADEPRGVAPVPAPRWIAVAELPSACRGLSQLPGVAVAGCLAMIDFPTFELTAREAGCSAVAVVVHSLRSAAVQLAWRLTGLLLGQADYWSLKAKAALLGAIPGSFPCE